MIAALRLVGWLAVRFGRHAFGFGHPPPDGPVPAGNRKPRIVAEPDGDGEPTPEQVRKEAFRLSAELRVLQDTLKTITGDE